MRTKEEFDSWFKKYNGDPWGYHKAHIRQRLTDSLHFIQKSVSSQFDGCFIEYGSFEGSFTEKIIANYPNAKIYAVDISDIATQTNKNKNGANENAEFVCTDMLSFKIPHLKNNRLIVLMLECLYYLNTDEREQVIQNVSQSLSNEVFISCPVISGKYFSETGLITLLRKYNFYLDDYFVLNFRKPTYSILGHFVLGRLLLRFFCLNTFIRNKISNQVIYKFKRIVA